MVNIKARRSEMEDIKTWCSNMVEAGSNPTLRHIPPNTTVIDTPSCLPLMTLNKGKTTFGRHPNNDFLIDSSTFKNFISRWHCKIERCQLADGRITYRIFDSSLNGTFVNDYRISKEGCLLNNCDKVIFGHLNGSNIKAGNYAPQPKSMFQYVLQNDDSLTHFPKNKNYKYVWSSPCCKKGKKCSTVHKKRLAKYVSPKVKKIAASSKDFKSEKSTTKDQSPPGNSKDKTKESFVDTSRQTRQQSEISMRYTSNSGFVKHCNSSEDSDVSLLDRVKLSVESFGVSDSDVLDSNDSPNKGL